MLDHIPRIVLGPKHERRLPSPQHRQLTRDYLRDKYRETPIGVVVVDGPIGLDFVLSWRGEMWSDVPVVFYGLDDLSAAQLKLPPNVTGFFAHQTFQGMVDAARVLVPGFKRVALVGDPVSTKPFGILIAG